MPKSKDTLQAQTERIKKLKEPALENVFLREKKNA